MTPQKRLFDLVLACLLAVLLAPVLLALAALIALRDGRPVLYLSERMQTPDRGFQLVKFRTMRPDPADAGVSGADKAGRITATGRLLRRIRADELPQLWNVIRGDISLVGPRPPLRQYVEKFPELYAQVLRARPGVTGLATLRFHRHEARILARSRSAAETDVLYCRACIPRKARLDLIYQAHQTLCLDAAILWQTVLRVLR